MESIKKGECMNAKEFYKEWGFWPIAGGVPEDVVGSITQLTNDIPVVEPPIVEPPSVVVTSPVVGLETTLDGDEIPEELRGKSLNEVIQMLRTPVPAQPAPPPVSTPTGPSQEEQIDQLRSEFYQDPIGTTMKLVQMSVAPIIENLYVDKAEKARSGVTGNKDFEMLEKDINEFMSNVPPNLRAHPQTWDIAYNYAKGKNFDKLASRGLAPLPVPADLPAGTSGGGTKVVSLSAEERVAIEKMRDAGIKITDEEYVTYK